MHGLMRLESPDRISTRVLGQGFAVLVVIVALGVAGATIAGVSV